MREVLLTVAAFHSARTEADYRKAKRMAGGLSREVQVALVDTMIAARKRVG